MLKVSEDAMPPSSHMTKRELILGVDVGGTFADVISLGSAGIHMRKAPSRPDDPGEDVLDGLSQIAGDLGLTSLRELLAQCALIIHGSTVATNILLTERGVEVGLLTTRGFRDILEMRGGVRESTFDRHMPNAPALAPRSRRLEIAEETDRSGAIHLAPNPSAVRRAMRTLSRAGVGAVAVAFKHSSRNPRSELDVVAMCAKQAPDIFISSSADLSRRSRLYDRTSTAVVNCYVGPPTRAYIERLLGKLTALGFSGTLLIMAGNGGVMSPTEAGRAPVQMILSGPAAGPIGAQVGVLRGRRDRDAIVIDMGGTSFDVSVIRDGSVDVAASRDVNRHRIAVPMLDIHTVGAGGGSIAWIDATGLLQVGPHSAGANPGPAAYRKGGTDPTVTDANLVLGLLDPGAILGGSQHLSLAASRASLRGIARRLGLSTEETARGIREVANGTMVAAIREVTIGRGMDPRVLPLVAAGGAGPLHGADLAASLGISSVVIPRHAGVLCALGMVATDVRYETTISVVENVEHIDPNRIRRAIGEATASLHHRLADFVDQIREPTISMDAEARYEGQFHELVIPLRPDDFEGSDRGPLISRFHKAHAEAYGFAAETTSVLIVAIRVRLTGWPARRPSRLPATGVGSLVESGSRRVYGLARGHATSETSVPVFKPGIARAPGRPKLLMGPALIDLPTTTVFVPPQWSWGATRAGDLRLVLGARGQSQ